MNQSFRWRNIAIIPALILVQNLTLGCSLRRGTTQNSSSLATTSTNDRVLSPLFAANCVRCHGPLGQGLVGPDIRKFDLAAVIHAVRNGFPQEMPAFTETQYPTDKLSSDYAALISGQATASNAPVLPALAPLRVGSAEDQVANARRYLKEDPTDDTGRLIDSSKNMSKARFGIFGVEPFVMPYVKCMNFPDKDDPSKKSRHCVNAMISGSTDEGYSFADFGVCKDIRTQRPFNPLRRPKKITDDPSDLRLQDPYFTAELDWVNQQIRSSGCVCCHDSKVDKNTAFWDISAPNNRLWIDQLDKYAVEVMTGRVDSTALGAYPRELNHGFDRHTTGLPSTDPARMQAFFLKLADKLGTTSSEIAQMPPLADILASQLRDPPQACKPGIGVHADKSIHWAYLDWYAIGGVIESILKNIASGNIASISSTAPFVFTSSLPIARYVYILRADSVTPLVPPNLDLPAGTIWRLDANRQNSPFFSGSTYYGQVPKGAMQGFPVDSVPESLIEGQKYYLDAQIDMAFPAQRCLFTYPAST